MKHLRSIPIALWLAAAGLAHAGGTLTVCAFAAPDGFDTVQYETVATADATGGLYDQLLAFKPGSSELAPGLAERWEFSADGLQLTLHLRRGVKFHTTPWFKPTRELNADDVLWSINRMNDPKHPAHGAARNGYVYWAGMNMRELLRRVDKIDEYTVRITLARPEAPLLANLAMPAIGTVYPAEYGQQLLRSGQLDRLNTQPVGSGPFVFRSYTKDATIRFAANAQYWGGAPKIDQMVHAITPDPNVRAQRLKAGECLIGTGMKRSTAASFDNDRNVSILVERPLATAFIAPNAQHKYLDDRRFREALNLAFDRKSYLQAIYGPHGKLAAGLLPPAQWGFDATLQPPALDLDRARKLVRESGYDGRELLLFASSGGSIDGKLAGEMLQSDWARIGVKIRVQLLEGGELARRSGTGEQDLVLWSWFSDNGDPDNFFTSNLSCDAVPTGGNKSRWCHPEFDRMIGAARRIIDKQDERRAIYQRAQRLAFDEVAIIPTVYPASLTAINKRVHGHQPNPFGIADFRRVSLD